VAVVALGRMTLQDQAAEAVVVDLEQQQDLQ
jgi:hypothetical protein